MKLMLRVAPVGRAKRPQNKNQAPRPTKVYMKKLQEERPRQTVQVQPEHAWAGLQHSQVHLNDAQMHEGHKDA